MIKKVHSFDKRDPNIFISVSFTSNRIAIKFKKDALLIYEFNLDRTIAGFAELYIEDADIESVSLYNTRLIVKSNGFYYDYDDQLYTVLNRE